MYQIEINREGRRVMTRWGTAVDDASLLEYQQDVWSDPALQGFDELIDFRPLVRMDVTTGGLKKVAEAAAAMDVGAQAARFAVVVEDPLSFGLARMYQAFRSLQVGGLREVRVFKAMEDAVAWLDEGGRRALATGPTMEE